MDELNDGAGLAGVTAQIERLTKEAKTTEVIELPKEPKGYYGVIDTHGALTAKLAERDWHGQQLETPAELVLFTDYLIEQKKLADAAVFVSREAVTLVRSLDDRRDRATCSLKLSPQIKWLLSPPDSLVQKEIVRALRVTFRSCGVPTELLSLLRSLRWNATGDVEGNIQHGKESLGKSIVNSVAGVEKIPEEVGLFVPVFDNYPTFRARVFVAIETLPEVQAFRLTPFPQEIENAFEAAMSGIRDDFAKASDRPKVFFGKP